MITLLIILYINKMKERIEYFDLAKGFCIILVVLMHLDHHIHLNHQIACFLQSFRMPLYFLLSGLFINTSYNSLDFFIKKTNKLLIPFVFFFLLTSCLLPFILDITLNVNIKLYNGWHTLYAFIFPCQYPNYPIWFLWVLFWSNMTYFIFNKILNKFHINSNESYYLFMISLCFSFLYHLYITNTDIFMPLHIDRLIIYMPFFCFGAIIKNFLLSIDRYTLRNKIIFVLLFGIICNILSHYMIDKNHLCIYIICFIISGISGSIMIISLSSIFKRIPIISFYGRYSIIILVSHEIVISFTDRLLYSRFNSFGYIDLVLVLFVSASQYPIILLFKKYIPWFVAQKNIIGNEENMNKQRRNEIFHQTHGN